jgi:hypothetical protein
MLDRELFRCQGHLVLIDLSDVLQVSLPRRSQTGTLLFQVAFVVDKAAQRRSISGLPSFPSESFH